MASQLSNRHALEIGVRYLDMLHVASAVLLKADRFLTFDLRQRRLAKAVGLDVKM
jgi:predicted nucleic acid-binding protein